MKTFHNTVPWFFLHIPKCAGTTLIHLLDQRFVQDEILPEHDRFLPLRAWNTADIQRYAWIRGHFPYTEIVPRLAPNSWMLLMMRDPIEMFLSHVAMRRRLFYPDEALSRRVYGRPLEDILRDEVAMAYFANFAAKMLGGKFPEALPDADPTWVWSEAKIDINAALERLQRFNWIGIVEHFDESLVHLERLFGFPPILIYQRANVSPQRPHRHDLSPKLQRYVEAINAMDIQLYRESQRLFVRQRQLLLRQTAKRAFPLVDNVEDDLTRVYPGQGWYPGERHAIHGVVRWTGPGPTTRLFYLLKGGKDRYLRLEIVNWAAPEFPTSLQCEVNGYVIPLRRRRVTWKDGSVGWMIEAKVPAEYWRQDAWQEITLRLPRTVQLPGESRSLGICLRHVSIS